jgi:hypothetical protein
MPFAPELKPVFETIWAVIETEPWNFVCRPADAFFAGGHILADILQGIREAEIVIADLSDRNPNVFYELGIAHMVKNAGEVLLLTQSMASIPFDLQGFRCIQYNSSEEGTRKLKEDLARALKEITSPVYRFVIKPRASIEFSHRLLGDGNCLYDFTVFADFLGVDAAKITLQVRRYVAGKENASF